MIALPPRVKAELQVACWVLTFIIANLDAAWDPEVLMTDASEEGGAVVATQAEAERIREEARWAPRGAVPSTLASTRSWRDEVFPDNLQKNLYPVVYIFSFFDFFIYFLDIPEKAILQIGW